MYERLKAKDLAHLRSTLLVSQGNRCALCMEPITSDPVCDHDHKSGLIRGTLHRGCNTLLGKAENGARRYGVNLQAFAVNLSAYLNQHQGVLHPSVKTPDEKKAIAKRRRTRAKAKAKAHTGT